MESPLSELLFPGKGLGYVFFLLLFVCLLFLFPMRMFSDQIQRYLANSGGEMAYQLMWPLLHLLLLLYSKYKTPWQPIVEPSEIIRRINVTMINIGIRESIKYSLYYPFGMFLFCLA